MRRFSTALAVGILLSSLSVFADGGAQQPKKPYDDWTCAQNPSVGRIGLDCVSCGLQTYYYKNKGRDQFAPSSALLAAMGVGAKTFLNLNPGEKSQRITTSGTAEMSYQKAVIAQIQAYGFCTTDRRIDWRSTYNLINRRQRGDKSTVGEWARTQIGVRGSGITAGGKNDSAYENFAELFNDAAYNQSRPTLKDKRARFLEKIQDVSPGYSTNKSDARLVAKGDDGMFFSGCLDEMRTEANKMSEEDSRDVCYSMAEACGISDTEFCMRRGMPYPSPGGGSGSSSQGGEQQQRPSQPLPTSGDGVRTLPAPPPANVQ